MIYNTQTTILSDENEYIPWIQLVNPTDEEIESILKEYNMPRDFITSGLDKDERSRYEIFDDKMENGFLLTVFLYPIIRTNSQTMDYYDTLPLSIVVADDVIITTSLETPSVLQQMAAIPDQVEKQFTSSFSWLLHLLWLISKDYIGYLKEIRTLLEDLEVQALSSTDNGVLYQIIGIDKALIYFETAIEGNAYILSEIESETEIADMNDEQSEILRDVQIEHGQAANLVEQYIKIADKLSDALNNVINTNMNVIMKRLTDWTILLTIPTIIGGMWGMNIILPLTEHPHGFTIISVVTIIICILVYQWLKKQNYW